MKIEFSITRGDKAKKPAAKLANPRQKWIFLAVYAASLIWVISRATPSRLYLDSKAYTNKQAGISINPPKRWQTKEGGSNLVEFDDSEFPTNNITVGGEATKLSLADYATNVKTNFAQAL